MHARNAGEVERKVSNLMARSARTGSSSNYQKRRRCRANLRVRVLLDCSMIRCQSAVFRMIESTPSLAMKPWSPPPGMDRYQ
jgi:hypothetical protein